MKNRDLMKKFYRSGWWMDREGSKHTIMTNGKDTESVPRHREIDEELAKAIIRRWGLK